MNLRKALADACDKALEDYEKGPASDISIESARNAYERPSRISPARWAAIKKQVGYADPCPPYGLPNLNNISLEEG